jgi:hypothetical protein
MQYPAQQIGTVATCPHCGRDTELELATPELASVVPRKTVVWLIVAVVILGFGVVASLVAVKRAQSMAARHRRAAPVADAGVGAAGSVNGPFILNDFQVRGIGLQTSPGAREVFIVGTVSNLLASERRRVELKFEVLGSTGQRLGSASDLNTSVPAHGEWRVRLPVLQPGAASVQLESIQEEGR